MKQLYKIILFTYLGIFVLNSLPREVFMKETKASKYLAFAMVGMLNLFMWITTTLLILKLF